MLNIIKNQYRLIRKLETKIDIWEFLQNLVWHDILLMWEIFFMCIDTWENVGII